MFVMPLGEDGVSNDLGGPSTKDAFDFVGADIEGNDRFDSISEGADRDDDGPQDLERTTDISYDANAQLTERTNNRTADDDKIQQVVKNTGILTEGNHSIGVIRESVAPFVHTPSVNSPNEHKVFRPRPQSVAAAAHTVKIHKRNKQDKQNYMCANLDDEAHNFYKDVNFTDPIDVDLARNRSTPDERYRPGDILRAHARETPPVTARAPSAPVRLQPRPPVQAPKSPQAALRFRQSCHVASTWPHSSSPSFAELWAGTGNLAKHFINRGGVGVTFEKAGHPDQDVVAAPVSRHIRAAMMSR
jgi:hypothetical protein